MSNLVSNSTKPQKFNLPFLEHYKELITFCFFFFPFRPPSAFNYWFSQNKESIQEDNPDLEDADLTKAAAQKWRTLSAEDKKVCIQDVCDLY